MKTMVKILLISSQFSWKLNYKIVETPSLKKIAAVWLYQEVERVSLDRLLRVRAQQLFATQPQIPMTSSN